VSESDFPIRPGVGLIKRSAVSLKSLQKIRTVRASPAGHSIICILLVVPLRLAIDHAVVRPALLYGAVRLPFLGPLWR